ncbi:MAG: class I SAM-dependent methyltransferase [Ekhidna sp.]
MSIQDFNNYFGDMDLFLMDLILKGHIKRDAEVLDIGCGEGRNGIYFIREAYTYHGWDTDASKLKLLEYLAKSIAHAKATFETHDIREAAEEKKFDLVICSRLLHFATTKDDFLLMWNKIADRLDKDGILYASMDSAVDTGIASRRNNGTVEFPDGRVSFALTNDLYDEIRKGFEEVEPLRTLVHHNERAQSFVCLRKL